MCGGFARFSSVQKFAELFGTGAEFNLNPRYNVAPTQALLLARNAVWGNRELVSLHWGLIPHWSKEPKTSYSSINARAETVAEKLTFRDAFRHRRCLIAADGYYEWRKIERTKQPYFITLKDGEPFGFAGVWEHWAREGESVDSCAIIVTEANSSRKESTTVCRSSWPPRLTTYGEALSCCPTYAANLCISYGSASAFSKLALLLMILTFPRTYPLLGIRRSGPGIRVSRVQDWGLPLSLIQVSLTQ